MVVRLARAQSVGYIWGMAREYDIDGRRVRITSRRRRPDDWDPNQLGLAIRPRANTGVWRIEALDELVGIERLRVLLHELLHVIEWRWDEDAVESISEALADVLDDQGYRRVGEHDDGDDERRYD